MFRVLGSVSRVSALRRSRAHFFSFTRAASAGAVDGAAESVAGGATAGGGAEGAGASGAGAPSAELAAARAALEAAQAALAEAKESRAYLAAEIENVRRIARADVDKARAFGAQPLAKALLMSVDCLAAAEAGAQGPAASAAALKEGVSATFKLLLKALAEHGVAQFGAPREKFNPNVHEAVAMVPAGAGDDAAAPGTIVNVLKTGFMFKDRVLRPAQVTVAAKPAAMAQAQAAADATQGSSRSI
jgi:molecular chaperone GrpE